MKELRTKIWNILEWLSLSAVIFTAIFFFLNFDSYSRLFVSKVDQLRNQNIESGTDNKVLNPSANSSQNFLPIVQNLDISRKQIPGLNLEVLPPDNRIYIPRIKQNVPVISITTEKLLKRDWGALEKQIQQALQDGVVHYPGTAEPGEPGNTVITGHSSYFPWDPGRFKDVFALLHQVNVGDTIEIYYNQKKYVYSVTEKFEVTPDKVEVLTHGDEEKITLLTCTPVGTNLRRLIVVARPVK